MKISFALTFLVSPVVAFTSSPQLRAAASATSSLSESVADETTTSSSSSSTTSAADFTESKADLEALARSLNPTVKFFDPLNLSEAEFWSESSEATIGWLRHAEIKHGRVAMAGFVGYCVQSNFRWPWAMTTEGTPFPSTDLGPEAQWDAIPDIAKWQIILFIGFLELYSESCAGETGHYMRGGQPGKFPTFNLFRDEVHPMPFDLYDPLRISRKSSPEKKERGLLAEINNGRLAMVGLFGFLCEDTIPGSVPALRDIAIPYDGDVMGPFTESILVSV